MIKIRFKTPLQTKIPDLSHSKMRFKTKFALKIDNYIYQTAKNKSFCFKK